MIELKNICKLYKTNNTFALQNINLSIDKGEFIAICGRSGAGKSTLINIIGFLDHFTKGEYFYNNQRVGQRDFKKQLNLRKNKIGFVVQNFALIPDNSVFYNISLPLMYQGLTKGQVEKKVEEVSEMLNINHLLKRFPRHISGGESQRVAIARTLVNNPDIILADEPTASLDDKNEQIILDIFKELNRKEITIVVVTHDQNVAKKSKRVIELSDGKIVSDNMILEGNRGS